MNRLDNMRDRLPPIWPADPGSMTHAVLALLSVQMAAYDQDMGRVQRTHWVDTAFDLGDLAKIGDLFQIAPAPWETESLFRARLKATIAARLRGAVSRDVLEFVLIAILDGAQKALGSRYTELASTAGRGVFVFHTGPDGPGDQPAFIEFPERRNRSDDLLSNGALRRPLAKISAVNTGLFPVPLQGVVRGVAGARTAVPLIANLTNGQVLVYRGVIACGQELRLGVDDDGALSAHLDGEDVSADVTTASGFAPGGAFTPVIPDPDPAPLVLERGENTLWVFPLALYDEPGLGSAVFAMPNADISHGRWDKEDQYPPFGKALFEQPPAVSLDLFWDEARPATFRIEIPAGIVRRGADADADPITSRERLFGLMHDTVESLSAAGTLAELRARPLKETQRQFDRMRVLSPTRLQDTQEMTSRLNGLTALFDISAEDGARFE